MPHISRRALALMALAPMLAGCIHTGGGGTALVRGAGATTRLEFISAETAADELAGDFGLSAEDAAGDASIARTHCGAPVVTVKMAPVSLAAMAGYALERGIAYLVDRIDEALRQELETYTASFAARRNVDFYAPGPSAGPKLRYTCFRLTRRHTVGGEEKVAMDFLGQIRLVGAEGFALRPLRLYYRTPQARTDSSNAYGVAISLKMDAVWREGNRGKAADGVVDRVLLSEKVTLAEGGYFYRTYADQPAARSPTLPLIPWSVYEGTDYGGSHVEATATVSEVGNPPWLLKRAAKLFHDKKGTIKSKLNEAANAVLPEGLGPGG